MLCVENKLTFEFAHTRSLSAYLDIVIYSLIKCRSGEINGMCLQFVSLYCHNKRNTDMLFVASHQDAFDDNIVRAVMKNPK